MSILVENLTKVYGDQKAVDDISFEVQTGEVVGLLSPNGAGKSTDIKMITCHMAATAGKISLEGFEVDKDPVEIKKKIGYLPENNPIYTDMGIIDYLEFCAEIQGLQNRAFPNAFMKW